MKDNASSFFKGWGLVAIVGLSLSGNAAAAVIEQVELVSSSFELTFFPDSSDMGSPRGFSVLTETSDTREIGRFSFNAADMQGLFNTAGDRNGWTAVSMWLTFTMFDGDTGVGDDDGIKDGHGVQLKVALGPTNSSFTTFEDFLLSGYLSQPQPPVGTLADPNIDLDEPAITQTNHLDLFGNSILGEEVATLISQSRDSTLVYLAIFDQDVGGNRLYFHDVDVANPQQFQLSIVMQRPIPLPASVLLLGSSMLALLMIRRRNPSGI